MKYCHNCGAQLEDSARFCTRCGTPVADAAAAAPAPTDTPPAGAAQTAPPQPPVPPAAPAPAQQPPISPASAAQAEAPQAPAAPADVAPSAPPQPPVSPAASVPVQQPTAPAQQPPDAPQKRRWGIAAQFPVIAAGQRPHASILTYFYGFYRLLYHKSYRLFCRTYLPCCLLFVLAIGLLSYAATTTPTPDLAMGASLLFLLAAAVWIVVVSIWLSRHYAQELYKQVQGDADRIPDSILPPILGGIALVALSVLAFVIGLAASLAFAPDAEPATPDSTISEPAPVEEPLPAEEAPAAETPAPTEEPLPAEESAPVQESADSAPDLSGAVPADDECWIVTADEPWKGAWYCEAEYSLKIFDANSQYEQYEVEQTPDGGYRIACYDARDGSFNNSYELSADQSTLTEFDMNGNLARTYRRPQFSEAYSPLPQDFWGVYTHVEGDSYLSEQGGPQENFVVDAFRFGNFGYQEVTDNGDGTYTFFLLMAPEGGYVTIGTGNYEGAPAFALYDNTGNVTDVYLRTE